MPSHTISQEYSKSETAQALIATLILLYSNAYLHELGHKYTAKWLTGAESTIEMELLAGYAVFDYENWKILTKDPKSAIATFLAGPIAGTLNGLAILASLPLLNKNPFWHHVVKSNAVGVIANNLINLIPFRLFGFTSDGYHIWDVYEKMEKGDFDKEEKLEKLADVPTAGKFAILKKLVKDPLLITDKEAIIAQAA